MMRRFFGTLALVAFAAAPALADPKSDLLASMGQFSKTTSFHVTAIGKGQTMEADMVLPSKMHMTAGPIVHDHEQGR
jgi:hypothetical protein